MSDFDLWDGSDDFDVRKTDANAKWLPLGGSEDIADIVLPMTIRLERPVERILIKFSIEIGPYEEPAEGKRSSEGSSL